MVFLKELVSGTEEGTLGLFETGMKAATKEEAESYLMPEFTLHRTGHREKDKAARDGAQACIEYPRGRARGVLQEILDMIVVKRVWKWNLEE